MKIAIFKSESGSFEKYSSLLRDNDIKAELIPSLDFAYKNLSTLAEHLRQALTFTGLIFTSPRAGLATREALADDVLDKSWHRRINYSVGESTWTEPKNHLTLDTRGRESGNAQKLSELIVREMEGQSRAPPFLFPCGNLKLDILQKNLETAGVRITPCEVYETVAHSDLEVNLQRVLDDPEVEFFVFFSPSGVNFCHELAQKNGGDLSRKKFVAIGPATKRAIEAKGLEVFGTADSPSPEGLLVALKHNKRKHEQDDEGPNTS